MEMPEACTQLSSNEVWKSSVPFREVTKTLGNKWSQPQERVLI